MISNELKKRIELLLFGSFIAYNVFSGDPFKEHQRCLEVAEKTYKSCLEANKEQLYRCLSDNCTNVTYAELCNDACFEQKENNDAICKDDYDVAKIECEKVFKKE